MFRGFLCVIPRGQPARPVFLLIWAFLNHHLPRLDEPNHERIFGLWYLAVREYSPAQQCDTQFAQLFDVPPTTPRPTSAKICTAKQPHSCTSSRNTCWLH